MKRFISLVLSLVLIISIIPQTKVSAASVVDSGDCGTSVTWSLDSDGVMTIRGSGDMDDFMEGQSPWWDIRDKIKKVVTAYGVTSIGEYSFQGCYNLEEITLHGKIDAVSPNEITKIGAFAFNACRSLKNIVIPASVTKIDSYAFSGCSSLESVKIPSSVVEFGDSVFSGCALETAGPLNCGYDYEFGWANNIIAKAFSGCSSLVDIYIPATVEKILQNAFAGCTYLKTINLPESLTFIGAFAFSNCTSLETIEYAGSESSWNEISKGNYWDNNIGNYTIDYGKNDAITGLCGDNLTWTLYDTDSNKTLDKLIISGQGDMWNYTAGGAPEGYAIGTFSPWYIYRDQITDVIIESGVTSIGDYAFKDDYSEDYAIETVSFPSTLERIGEYSFNCCRNLTEINIPDSVTSIGGHAFQMCVSLETIKLPSNINVLEEAVFAQCSSLAAIDIPQGVIEICHGAFANDEQLKSVNIPDTVKIIGPGAFHYCHSLPEIVIPEGVETIDDGTFLYCNSMSKITLPTTIKTIDYEAFRLCYSLNDVYYNGSQSEWNDIIIDSYGNEQLTNATFHYGKYDTITGSCGENLTWVLENGVLTISGTGPMYNYEHEGAPWYAQRNNITDVVIENGVTSIGSNAFANMDAIERATLAASVTGIGIHSFSFCDNLEKLIIYASEADIQDGFLINTPKLKTAGPIGSGCNIEFAWETMYDGLKFSSVETAIIPDGIYQIQAAAFYNCQNLHTVTVPESIREIAFMVFSGCPNLTDVYYLGSQNQWEMINIGSDNESLFNAEVHYAKENTPNYCGENLTWVLGNGVLTISGTGEMYDYDFENNNVPTWYNRRDKITSVVIENGVTSIGSFAFYSLHNVEEITVPSSVTKINDLAFAWCTSITEIIIPEGVTSIGRYVFNSCTNLNKVLIPASVTDIEDSIFSGTPNLKTAGAVGTGCDIEFAWETRIPANAFSASSIESITIPDGITNIGCHALSFNENLKKVIIPASATTIEDVFMVNCPNLKTAGYLGSGCNIEFGWTMIYEKAFMSSSIESVTIPDVVYHVCSVAFYNCQNLHTVNMSENVCAIGGNAFDNCPNLTEIHYGGSQGKWNDALIYPENEGLFGLTIRFGKYDITVGESENGTVSVDKAMAKPGEVVTVTAVPADGYELDKILVNGKEININVFAVTGNCTVTASFKAVENSDTTVTVNNTASEAGATVTAPEGGWKEGENTFTVSAEIPCVVLVSHDGGQTYTRVPATATGTEGTYSFTADITAGTQVSVAVAGDFNKDGEISVADITRLKAAYRNKVDTDGLQTVIGDINGDGEISVADITRLKAAYRGKITLAW